MTTTTKQMTAKWIIICASVLWIAVGTWGIYNCFQIAKLKTSNVAMVNASFGNADSISTQTYQDLNTTLGLNVLQASMVFVACVLSSIFVLYSVLALIPTGTTGKMSTHTAHT